MTSTCVLPGVLITGQEDVELHIIRAFPKHIVSLQYFPAKLDAMLGSINVTHDHAKMSSRALITI